MLDPTRERKPEALVPFKLSNLVNSPQAEDEARRDILPLELMGLDE
jgi:hypothetical protein